MNHVACWLLHRVSILAVCTSKQVYKIAIVVIANSCWCRALQDSGATGLTMALVDLRVVDSSLDSTMNALATTLTQQLRTTPGEAGLGSTQHGTGWDWGLAMQRSPAGSAEHSSSLGCLSISCRADFSIQQLT